MISVRTAQQIAYAHVIEGRSWQVISAESGIPILVCQRVATYWMKDLEKQRHALEQMLQDGPVNPPA